MNGKTNKNTPIAACFWLSGGNVKLEDRWSCLGSEVQPLLISLYVRWRLTPLAISSS